MVGSLKQIDHLAIAILGEVFVPEADGGEGFWGFEANNGVAEGF